MNRDTDGEDEKQGFKPVQYYTLLLLKKINLCLKNNLFVLKYHTPNFA